MSTSSVPAIENHYIFANRPFSANFTCVVVVVIAFIVRRILHVWIVWHFRCLFILRWFTQNNTQNIYANRVRIPYFFLRFNSKPFSQNYIQISEYCFRCGANQINKNKIKQKKTYNPLLLHLHHHHIFISFSLCGAFVCAYDIESVAWWKLFAEIHMKHFKIETINWSIRNQFNLFNEANAALNNSNVIRVNFMWKINRILLPSRIKCYTNPKKNYCIMKILKLSIRSVSTSELCECMSA